MTKAEATLYIKELQKTYAPMDKKVAEAVDMATEALSAEKTGGWIIKKSHPDDVYEHMWCSECNAFFSVPDFKSIFNYCPNCGAKMEK